METLPASRVTVKSYDVEVCAPVNVAFPVMVAKSLAVGKSSEVKLVRVKSEKTWPSLGGVEGVEMFKVPLGRDTCALWIFPLDGVQSRTPPVVWMK